MYIEIKKQGRSKKYYLVHAYRMGDKIKKIRRYLGSNLSKKKINGLRPRAEEHIREELNERSLIEYELSKDEIKFYKKYDKKIDIEHLQKYDWKKFTAIFTYNTNAIEGSAVELSEVRDILEHKEKPQDAGEIEALDVANALEYMKKTKDKLSVELINKIHYYCFKNTKHFAGELRKVEVVVRDGLGNIVHKGACVKDVKRLLKELIEWYELHKRKYPPLLLAALVHNQFETIHPFQDGNGRVGRILLNYILKKHRYPFINIRLKDRAEYYKVLSLFQKYGDVKPTLRFLIKQYKIQYRYVK